MIRRGRGKTRTRRRAIWKLAAVVVAAVIVVVDV
jgi:hypothetical protein